jgi:alpha-glucoside transport system substrate-binding protein
MTKYRWLVLVAVLAMTAAACGTPAATTTTTAAPDTTTTTSGDGETTTTAEPGASTGYEHLDRALAGEFEGTTVEVWAQWLPDSSEAANFDYTLEAFRAATGIDVQFEPTVSYETALPVAVDGGNAPDIAQVAQPGSMHVFAEEGSLVNLSDWFNVDKLTEDLCCGLVEQGSYNGSLYGVYYKTDVKSIVWYPVQAFADAGYAVPTSWEELVALSDQIVADGSNPWCISIQHEAAAASGWVATDWMEDILLRTAPLEIYSQWYNHEIPFNHPEVLEAAEYMSQIWFTPDYAYGGNVYMNQTFIGETQDPMFADGGPDCWMQKQAAWITGFWGANRDFPDDPTLWPNQPGENVAFFYFPPIEEEFGSPVLGGADMWVMFNESATGRSDDRPEVRALLEWLATPEGAEGWIERGGFLGANKNIPLDWYTSYPNNELAVMVSEATAFGFDASDLMDASVGKGTFWTEMIRWVDANGEGTEEIFQNIEDSWPS